MPVDVIYPKVAMGITLALKNRLGTDVALFFQFLAAGKRPELMIVENVGRKDMRDDSFDYGSAIVNAIERKPLGKYDEGLIAASYQPTARDKGMCRMIFMDDLLYYDGTEIRQYYRSGSGLSNPWLPSAKGAGQQLDESFYESKTVRISRTIDLHDTDGWLEEFETNARISNNTGRSISTIANGRIPMHASFFPPPATPYTPVPNGRNGENGNDRKKEIRHAIFSAMAWYLVAVTAQNRKHDYRGHNIASILRAPDDSILGWAINTNRAHTVFHGEINAIQYFQDNRTAAEQGHEIGSTSPKPILYSTLQSCHMCAGMWAESGDALSCVYDLDDQNINNSSLSSDANHNINNASESEAPNFDQSSTDSLGNKVKIVDLGTQLHDFKMRAHRGLETTRFLNGPALPLILDAAPTNYQKLKDVYNLNASEFVEEKTIWQNGFILIRHAEGVVT